MSRRYRNTIACPILFVISIGMPSQLPYVYVYGRNWHLDPVLQATRLWHSSGKHVLHPDLD